MTIATVHIAERDPCWPSPLATGHEPAGAAPPAPRPAARPRPAEAAARPGRSGGARPGPSAPSRTKVATAGKGAVASAKKGYAPSSAKTTSAKKTSSSGEFAFLDSKTMSIEEKLFRFIKLMTEKNDRELVAQMNEYRGKYARKESDGGSTAKAQPEKKDDGGGFFGFLGDIVTAVVCPPLALNSAILGRDTLKGLAKELGGPLLAAAATAAGLPHLAPVALRVAPKAVDAVFKAVDQAEDRGSSPSSQPRGGSAGSSSGSTSAGSAGADSPDERIAMLELQRLVEKQQAMYAALSNVLKTLHDAQMTAVHNLR